MRLAVIWTLCLLCDITSNSAEYLVLSLQENVSCLNTSLVFLMFANQKAQLPSFLREMARAPVEGACKTSSSPLMKNFRYSQSHSATQWQLTGQSTPANFIGSHKMTRNC